MDLNEKDENIIKFILKGDIGGECSLIDMIVYMFMLYKV